MMAAILLTACGDSTVIVPGNNDSSTDVDARTDNTNGSTNGSTNGTLGDPPTGPTVPEPDLPDPTMPEPEPDPEPVVQPAYKVQQAVDSQCSTGAVKGLSVQLLDQMNCLSPGIMKSFAGNDAIKYSATVFPFQQGPATETLVSVVSGGGTLTVNSALRTLPQQYLLYQWYVRGLCNANLAAKPGASNHNGGLAIDINDSGTWRTRLRNRSYIDNVSGEAWHFYYSGAGGRDVRSLSVLAFQKLWNRNYPNEPIDEDGIYGPQTEGALKRAPAEGFAIPPMCMATMQFVGYTGDVPIEALVEEDGKGDAVFRVLTTSGIEVIEYQAGGGVLQSVNRNDDPFFQAQISIEDYPDVTIVGYDSQGAVRGVSEAVVRRDFIARPTGDGHYSVSPRAHDAYLDPLSIPAHGFVVPGWQEMLVSTDNIADLDVSVLR